MFIDSIQFSAFRGQSASHALTPATLVVGHNGSGKTTIKQAVQLAILGHIPGRSKTNRDPYINATVGVHMSDGETLKRSYSYTGGSVKENIETSLFDSEVEMLATPTLDASEYFTLGPTAQVQYIFSRMELPDTHSAVGILKELADAEFPAHPSEHVIEAKETVASIVRGAFTDGVAEGLAKLTGEKGAIATPLKYWKQRVKETLGNLRIAAELQARAEECSAETLADIRAEIEVCAVKLRDANRNAGALTQRRMNANRVTLRKKEIETLLALPPVDHSEAVAAHREQIKELTAARWEDKDAPSLDVLEAHLRDKTGQLAAAKSLWDTLRETAEEAANDLAAIDSLTECPKCGAKAKGWKMRLATTQGAAVEAASKKLTAAEDEWERINGEYLKAKADAEERRGIEQANRKTDDAIYQRERVMDRLINEQKVVENNRRAMEDELARLVEEDGPTPEQLAESSAQVQFHSGVADGLAKRLDTATRLQHEIATAAKGEQEHVKAKAYQAVMEDAKKRLKERQVSTIDAMFQGLIEKANYFTHGIIPEPLIFREGEIGRIVRNEFVSASDVSGFSDAERAITYVAVAAALASQSPFKLAILDEVKIDEGRMRKVMGRLLEAIDEGFIDQAIMTHTSLIDASFPGGATWSVIDLNKEVAA